MKSRPQGSNWALRRTSLAPALFGSVLSILGLTVTAVGLVAAVLQMVDPAFMVGSGRHFACPIFYLVVGWKVYGLSRVPQGVLRTAG